MFNENATLNFYAGNNMCELRKLTFPMIKKIGGLSDKDYDDFYSIANSTLSYCVKNYDESKNDNFKAYLIGSIARKFKTEMTRRNRDKRIKSSEMESLDAYAGDTDVSVGELIDSGFRIENEIPDLSNEENVANYLDTLSSRQKEIAILVIKGYELEHIRTMLGMSEKKFSLALSKMRDFQKGLILRNRNC